jgi:hypothetical protein
VADLIFYVDANRPDDSGDGLSWATAKRTIQAGINATSQDGQRVVIAKEIYTGAGNYNLDPNHKFIVIKSTEPENPDVVNATIIDPNKQGCGFNLMNNSSFISGLTIQNGTRGIKCISNSSPTVSHCIIKGNDPGKNYYGAGIYTECSSLKVKNCTIIDNNTSNSGGGIFSLDSTLMITDSNISRNTAQYHGGIFESWPTYSYQPVTHGPGSIINCTISNNTAKFQGGLSGNLDPTDKNLNSSVINCRITNNIATYTWGGGGINNYKGSLTNCIISGNIGVGLNYCHGQITNCLITGNKAGIYGGAGLRYCTGSIINCTITENIADSNASGLIGFTGSIINSIIWNNGDIEMDYIDGQVTYCDIKGGWAGLGNIDADPYFVQAGYRDSNGVWVEGDYHLKSEGWRWDADANQWTWDEVTSRCIDAGNPGMPLGDEPLTLPVDPLNRFGRNVRIDMGHYGGTKEASMAPPGWAKLADLTNDGAVDFADLREFTNDWLGSDENLPGDLDRNGMVNMVDFALLAKEWLN